MKKKEEHKKLGRPFKGNAKRVQITTYIDVSLLQKMDMIVETNRAKGDFSYSRSEVINQAIKAWLNKK